LQRPNILEGAHDESHCGGAGKPDSVHLAELATPSIDEVPGGRGVLVKVLRVGVDGTDKEINAAEYGAAPDGHHFLVIGHEGFGRVEAVGDHVTEVGPATTSSPPCGGRARASTTSSAPVT
jgi:threonine dehydrogenase-like Zn-dependent dehydrogenase